MKISKGKLKDLLAKAYIAGFDGTCEGGNAECTVLWGDFDIREDAQEHALDVVESLESEN